MPGLFVHGDTREIAHLLVEASEGIEEGGFPAVGVAYQCYMQVLVCQIVMNQGRQRYRQSPFAGFDSGNQEGEIGNKMESV
jgi:hypothetical protein